MDVFVHDLLEGTTVLVSVNEAATGSGNDHSFDPVISADGRFVAFQSRASDLIAGDSNGTTDVFVRDLITGTTTLVSENLAGTGTGAGASRDPVMTPDARLVAFVSFASDLVTSDGNSTADVFLRDMQTGTTTLVSVNLSGTASGNERSYFPSITPDGQRIAFLSRASDLVATDWNLWVDVFVRDLNAGVTTLASRSTSGWGGGDDICWAPVISQGGDHVAFLSRAGDLTSGALRGRWNVYVHDLVTSVTTLESVRHLGDQGGNADSSTFNTVGKPAISNDGRFVAFVSQASDLFEGDANDDWDVFVRDRRTGVTRLASRSIEGSGSGSGSSLAPVISDDGRSLFFRSTASNLDNHPADTNGDWDVFRSVIFVDSDGDGMDDGVDEEPLNPSLRFTDGVSSGRIVGLDSGIQVEITKELGPIMGFRIFVSGVDGLARLRLDGYQGLLKLSPGEYMLGAGSLILQVWAGAAAVEYAIEGSQVVVDVQGSIVLDEVTLDGVLQQIVVQAVAGEVAIDGMPLAVGDTWKLRSVAIDVQPGGQRGCLNSDGNGVIPVAILGMPDFDASGIDPSSVALAGQFVRVVGNGRELAHLEDVNDDGIEDLVVQIDDSEAVYGAGAGSATLTGETFDGVRIIGADEICVVP